jgi:hypothetical protein
MLSVNDLFDFVLITKSSLSEGTDNNKYSSSLANLGCATNHSKGYKITFSEP